jgi:hypothetical protein
MSNSSRNAHTWSELRSGFKQRDRKWNKNNFLWHHLFKIGARATTRCTEKHREVTVDRPGWLDPCTHRTAFLLALVGVRLSPVGTSATNCFIVSAPDDRWWMWSSRWNENWQGKPKNSEKTCPVPLCPPQIPHEMTWVRTRAAAVGSLSYGTTLTVQLVGSINIRRL